MCTVVFQTKPVSIREIQRVLKQYVVPHKGSPARSMAPTRRSLIKHNTHADLTQPLTIIRDATQPLHYSPLRSQEVPAVLLTEATPFPEPLITEHVAPVQAS
jgi:hypothetical protein